MPATRHLTETQARAFLRSALGPEETKWVVRHLLGRCARCSALMQRVAIKEGFVREPKPEGRQYSFEDIVIYLQAERMSLALDRLAGLAQVAVLDRVPAESRLEAVKHHKDFQHVGLYDRLIEWALDGAIREPDRAIEMAALAIAVAAEVKIGPALRNDLMAEGYATLGRIRRLAHEFTGARDAYTQAWAYRQDGTSDPMVDARIMREEAAWFVDLGNLDEAEALLRNARKEYQGINDTHREGRTLLELGILWTYYDPQAALARFAQAEPLIDFREEPALAWSLRHHTIWATNDLSRAEEALMRLEKSRGLYATFARFDRSVNIHLHWLEGRIALNLSRMEVAEEILRHLFSRLIAGARHPIEGTQVALDILCAIALQKGRMRDAVRFVEAAAPILQMFGLHEHGMRLWHSLIDRLVTGARIPWRDIRDYLRRSWHKPAAFVETEPQ